MMSEKNRQRRRTGSIALRMTVWYVLSAIALLFTATGFLYWVLSTNLDQEDIRLLTDSLNNVQLLLRSVPTGALSALPLRSPAKTAQEHQIYFRILDADGRVRLETPGMSHELPLPSRAELALAASAKASDRDVSSRSGKLFETLSSRLPGSQTRFVQVAIDRSAEERLLARYRQRMWVVLSVSAILCSLVGYLIARSGMRPIESIARTAERIRSTTLYERIETPGLPTELSGLAETFNDMLDRLEESFSRVSQFSDDAAHELRTPINNLRGEIEVALRRGRSEEEYREILGSCLEECARISRVIHSLLFLARTESTTSPLDREEIEVGKELAAVQEFYDAAAAEAGVALGVSVAGDLTAPLNRTLFRQAVSNLVSNAIAHTPDGGTVRIAATAATSWLDVLVTDTGCGIPAEHLPRVFDRFYRVDKARAGSEHKAGLGLAVVKSIVSRHGGDTHIRSEIDTGTEVRMRFPRSV